MIKSMWSLTSTLTFLLSFERDPPEMKIDEESGIDIVK